MNLNLPWSNALVDELIQNGADAFFCAPGSRNAPLLYAIQKHPLSYKAHHFDERSLGFYALGYAKATQKIATLVCTSGSAAAHFYPAVMEAFHSNLPLIILTADRPPESIHHNSNQTTDQLKLYGNFVHHFLCLPHSFQKHSSIDSSFYSELDCP